MQINNIGMIWASVYVSTAGTEMKRREKVGGRNNDHWLEQAFERNQWILFAFTMCSTHSFFFFFFAT